MNSADHTGTPQGRWPLGGFWLAWFWISWLIGVVIAIAGLAGATALALAAGTPVAFAIAVIPVAIGGFIGWQLLHTATEVRLDPGGTVVLRRQLGTIRVPVEQIRAMRPSALRSGYTPTVIETAQGWAYLIHTRAVKIDLAETLRRHNPQLRIEIR